MTFDAEGRLTDAFVAGPAAISELLTDMAMTAERGEAPPPDVGPNEAWGELVIARLADGDVLEVDPELFWDGIHRLYRSRSVDYDTERPRAP